MKNEFLELHRKYSNNENLGEYLRNIYVNDLNADSIIVKMVREIPNDFMLGEAVRSLMINS